MPNEDKLPAAVASPQLCDEDLSIEHLNELIGTLRVWSMNRPWTRAQTAAWRLRWFGRTPQMDAAAADTIKEYEQYGSDEPKRWEPRIMHYPNGQGVFD